jgi:hypothetical protein
MNVFKILVEAQPVLDPQATPEPLSVLEHVVEKTLSCALFTVVDAHVSEKPVPSTG